MVTDPVRSSTAQAPSSDERVLLRQWHVLHSGVRRLTDDLLADLEEDQGLAPSSFQALTFLATAPGQAAPMNRLSAALGFSTAGTTKVVDRLADAGLVERRPSAADRRVVYTALTPVGAETAHAAAGALAQALRRRVVLPLGEDVFRALSEAVGSLDRAADGGPHEAPPVPPCP
jgi:DNA-binding MarR family transcriptional regulator